MKDRPLAVILAATLMAIGSLLPWVSFGIFSAAGTEGDGIFTLAIGVIVAVLAAVRGYSPSTKYLAVIGGVLGVFITGSIFADIDTDFAGAGLVLTLVASLVLAIAGFGAGGRKDALEPEMAGGEPPPPDRYAELERLANLRERGALSEEEFSDAKKRLLDS